MIAIFTSVNACHQMMISFSLLAIHPAVVRSTEWVIMAIALTLLVPIAVLLIECLAAVWPYRSVPLSQPPNVLRCAILMPAHNEVAGIHATLQTILPQLTDNDRLVVIADNCDDGTADLVRSLGVTVLERHDEQQRGKGYALDYGLQFLADDPPDVVVMMDADCTVQPQAISQIVHLAAVHARPVQAAYLMNLPPQPSPKSAVSFLAFTVKNLVRPLGLAQFGLPCLLTGTGMAFPWSVIREARLASGNIVEDMQLGVDLAISGYPPIFCANAKVTGLLPQQQQTAKSQRTRWEHGHLQTLLTQVPRLLKAAIQQQRGDLLAIALDLSVPPLSLLVMVWLIALGFALVAYQLGTSVIPVMGLVAQGLLIGIAIFAAWGKFCRTDLSALTLLTVPLYILWKVPLYFAFLVQPQKKWIRTDREPIHPPKG
jgi:cellulose synthase/poly-beta-1,6-N-acetylglucosamine synthase-like glycosyltransferase